VDQFHKRFSSKRFINVLNENIDSSLEMQQKKLELALDNFQGSSEQRDDITVLGARIV